MTTRRSLKLLQIGDSLCSAEPLSVMVIGVQWIKDMPREGESGSVHERERNSREGNRAPGYSANTANPVTLLQARTSPFMERCCKRCVNTAFHFSSLLNPFPLPLWPFTIREASWRTRGAASWFSSRFLPASASGVKTKCYWERS